MKYFVVVNNEKKGPLTFDELLVYNISKETLIWREGMDDWGNVKDLEEFDEYFKSLPPYLPKNNETFQFKKSIIPGILYAVGFSFIATLLFYGGYYYFKFPEMVEYQSNIEIDFLENVDIGLDSTISSQNSSSAHSVKSPKTKLQIIAEGYNPDTKFSRAGAADTRIGAKSDYDKGFNPMYADQNLYRQQNFYNDIVQKTKVVFWILMAISTTTYTGYFFNKTK